MIMEQRAVWLLIVWLVCSVVVALPATLLSSRIDQQQEPYEQGVLDDGEPGTVDQV